jgi:CRP-like cAMP-binding protein
LSYATRAEILKKSLIFSSLKEDELDELSKLAIERNYKPDDFIFWEEDPPDYFYIIIEGRIKK